MSSLPPAEDKTVIRPRATTTPTADAAPARVADRGHTLAIGTYLGEFELTDMLGEGGFGIVYLAWDHSLERRVALKEYMPSALAMRGEGMNVNVRSERHRETFDAGLKSFVNEARLLAQFDHPSLVKVYRFWEANGTAYMVMPFYEGITLKDKLKALGHPPDENWLVEMLAPLTEALAVIHRENCFHRDIAPDNVILLEGSGRPLLLDFGAARRVIGDMTQALTVILKPGYAPVEQYAEAPGMKQGPWTDIYALAASIYYAMLGTTPPPSVSRLIGDSYVPLAESCAGRYSARFLEALDKALRVRPDERTQSITELRADLGLGAAAAPAAAASTHWPHAAPSSGSSSTVAHTSSNDERTLAAPKRHVTPPPAAAAAALPAAPANKALLWAALGAGALVILALAAYFALTPSSTASKPGIDPPALATQPATQPVTQPITQPSSPPVAQQAEPTPPAAFDISAEFDRVLTLQSAGFDAVATPDKAQLRIDKDNLGFKLKSQREGYVTVLVHGPDGTLTRLIPNETMPEVRIKAGQTLHLPPREQGGIGVGEPPGHEHFLVLVSSKPRDYGMLNPKVESGYLLLPTGVEAAGLKGVRGLSPLLGDSRGCTGGACDDYGAARFSLEVVR